MAIWYVSPAGGGGDANAGTAAQPLAAPSSQLVLNAAATGFTLDPSSPESGQIGTTIGGLPVWSAIQTAAHIARAGATWADHATNVVVSYAFANSQTAATGFEPLDAQGQAGALAAMQLYADVSGIRFVAASDPEVADVTFRYIAGSTNGGGWASFPNSGGVTVNVGHVSWEPTHAPGTFALHLMLHELGHGIGLNHPGNYNGSGATYADADHFNDSYQYTNMSYWSESVTGASFGYLGAPGLHDILALQLEYGINWSTRADSTVYGFGATAGASFDFSGNNRLAFSIWDGGGVDTLNFSGFSGNTIMDLRQGGFSSTGLDTYNVSIAYGAVIENATGGSGNDRMLGNTAGNVLSGGLGNDVIFGGSETSVVAARDPREFTGILLNDAPLTRNQYLSAGSSSSLSHGAFTIEMLVDIVRSPAGVIAFASYAVGSGGASNEVLIQGTNDDFVSIMIGNLRHQTTIRTESLIDGDPHRLSVTWDSATGQLNTYVDGVLRDSVVHQQGVSIRAGGTLVFGQEQDSVGGGFAKTEVFQGTIGDIRVFNDVRTAAEIGANAFTSLTGTEQGLINNWQVKPGDTTKISDIATANPPVDLTSLLPAGTFTASQSSTYPGGAVGQAFDNNNSTFSHTNSGDQEWLRLDFAALALTYIEIVNRPGQLARLNGATVSVLDAQGTVLFTSAPITNAGSVVTVWLPDNLIASRIQIDRARSTPGTENIINISELNVFGQPPAGVTVPPALINTDLSIVNGGTVRDTAPALDLTPDNDTLRGGAGNDHLYGGAGNDQLYGHGDNAAQDSRFAPVHAVELNAGAIANQYAVVSTYAGITGAAGAVQFSIEMLVNISRLPSEVDFFTYANTQTANAIGLALYPNGNIHITYRGTAHDTGLAASLLTTGGEHRLSLTWDGRAGGGYVIYIDGVEAGRGTHPNQTLSMNAGGTLIFGQEQDSIGGGFQTSQIFPGTIADIRVFNDVRTAAEIAANAFGPLANPTTEQGLVNNWQVAADTTTTIADARGGTALTLVGGPTSALFGRWDDDVLDGGIGNDRAVGGAGADRMDGGANSDTVDYFVETGTFGVYVNLSNGVAFDTTRAGDTLLNFENVEGTNNTYLGGYWSDFLIGSAVANIINGHDGIDYISGGAGADVLNGDGGIDYLIYNDSNDTGTAGVYVNLQTNTARDTSGAFDSLSGFENIIGTDKLYQSGISDVLIGDAGLNTIFGQGGTDYISGGGGRDYLFGGLGTDRFNLGSEKEAGIIDFIFDFNTGGDRDNLVLAAADRSQTSFGDYYGYGYAYVPLSTGGAYTVLAYGATGAELQAQTLFI